MFGLPASTELRRAIPKDALFNKFKITGKEKARFDNQIHKITVLNVINSETINLGPSENVKAIHVIEVQLNEQNYDAKIVDLLPSLERQVKSNDTRSDFSRRWVTFRNTDLERVAGPSKRPY